MRIVWITLLASLGLAACVDRDPVIVTPSDQATAPSTVIVPDTDDDTAVIEADDDPTVLVEPDLDDDAVIVDPD